MKFLQKALTIAVMMLAAARASGDEVRPLATNAPAAIELNDQYDVPQKLVFPATNITVLTIADRKGSEQVDDWISVLKPRYAGRITFCGIAAVGGAPAFVHARIRKKFQEARTFPVMMDWSGKVCAQFSYKKDVANILVMGRDGAILGRFSGVATGPNIAETCALLDQALSNPPQVASDLGKSTTP
jgi:hypothetical protein